MKTLVKRGADLHDPESIKEVITQQHWSEGYKQNVVDAYQKLLELQGIVWSKPFYKRVEKLPFIPIEKEIDALIARMNYCIAAFLQLLKETAIRPGEAWNLRWVDVDHQRQCITVTPETHSLPRQCRISSQCLAMLYTIPRASEYVFREKYRRLTNLRRTYQRHRNKLAKSLVNPRIREINFKTLRHWKATVEYHKTKDILHVKKLLGHKNIQNTLIYTHLVDFKSDEWVCKVAQSLEEAVELVEAGFEYVTEVEGKKIFRKRK
ncbi:MAG: tyrosine-type recombinase/integrase [Candidatus Bathyarchaeota archaeon]|nr:tyrosine-type recombinase/integrase [Candidatus Bathyarchaeota archaeon]